jgi:hypothetical protein
MHAGAEVPTRDRTEEPMPYKLREWPDERLRRLTELWRDPGSISPIRCAAAIFVTRELPASNRPRGD